MPKKDKKNPGVQDIIDAIHANTQCMVELKTVMEGLQETVSTIETGIVNIESTSSYIETAVTAIDNSTSNIETAVIDMNAAALATVNTELLRIANNVESLNSDKANMHVDLIEEIQACRPRPFK